MIKNTSAGSTDWLVYDNKRGATAAAGAVGYGNNNKYFINRLKLLQKLTKT